MKKTRIVLADDHNIVRAGFKALLGGLEGVEVVAEAADGREAIRLVKELAPDVIVMDISMRGLNGIEATGRIADEFPNTHVLILSMHTNEEYVLQALRAGAFGYLLKEAATDELEFAVRTVARGERYLSPAVSKTVIDDYLTRVGGEAGPLEHLTSRQREILQLIAEGKSTKEIAGMLNLSVKTVETHRAQLMNRLAIRDVAGLVRFAVRVGLVTAEP